MDFDDLSLAYADAAATVTHNPASGGTATAGLAFFDQPGSALIGGEMLATDYSLRYPAATFPAVKRGDTVTIATVVYTVRENPQPASIDGLELIVPLSRSA